MEELFAEALRAAYPAAVEQWGLTPAVAVCANPAFGDYQCNSAMPLFQRLKQASGSGGAPPPASPRLVAETLLRSLPASPLIATTRRVSRAAAPRSPPDGRAASQAPASST